MSNVKSFNVNGTTAPINIVNDTEDGFMSSQDYIKLVDISSGVNLNVSSNSDNIYPNEVLNIIDCPEYIHAKTDSTGKILESIDVDGNKRFYGDVTVDGELSCDTIDALNSSINTLSDYTSEIPNLSTSLYNVQQLLNFFDFAIDPSLGVLRICGKMYKLIDYEGDATFDEYIDARVFVYSTDKIDSSEFSSVITDSEDKVLYGLYVDNSETNIDLYGITVTNPSTGDEVTLGSVVNSLK